jgi:hypothetical protein
LQEILGAPETSKDDHHIRSFLAVITNRFRSRVQPARDNRVGKDSIQYFFAMTDWRLAFSLRRHFAGSH